MISCTRSDGICTLTLNRPDKANSLTRDMLADLTSAVQAAQAQADKVLVITGQGKVFSAGADLDQARAGLARDGIWEALSGAIAAFDGLSIAALNGTLAGGAFGMALACDLRISVPEELEEEKVLRVLKKAEDTCLITNSLNATVTLNVDITRQSH